MAVGPPRLLSSIVGHFLPPATREHVLGDLAEQYVSPSRYLWDACRILPFVVASQIRRSWGARVLAVSGLSLWYLLVMAAALTDVSETQFYAGDAWISRIATVACVLTAMTLLDAYTDSRRTVAPLIGAMRYGMGTIASVLFAQGLLGALSWDLVLHTPQLATAAGPGALAIGIWRFVLLKQQGRALRAQPAATLSQEALSQRLWDFQGRIGRRNTREYVVAAAVIGFFGYWIWVGSDPRLTAAMVLLIAATSYAMHQLYRRGSLETVPKDVSPKQARLWYRTAARRQADLLNTVWSWYLLPFVPAFLVAVTVTPYARLPRAIESIAVCFVTVCLASIELNKREARRLLQEVRTLPPVDNL